MGVDRGGRSGGGRKGSSRSQSRREAPKRTAATEGAPGPSRLLLTRLIREGSIWNVYIVTSAQPGAPNVTELEFEDTGANAARYSRRVDGKLLEALHNGAPVSRSSLQDELELALVAAGTQSIDVTDTLASTEAAATDTLARAEAAATDTLARTEAAATDGTASTEAAAATDGTASTEAAATDGTANSDASAADGKASHEA